MKTTTLVSIVLLSGWIAATSHAQSFTPEEQRVWAAFQEAGELNDVKALEKIAQRNRDELESIFDKITIDLAFNDSLGQWDNAKTVGRALDGAQGGNYHRTVLSLLEKMTIEARKKRLEHRDTYDRLRNAIQQAVENNDKKVINETIPELEALAQEFQNLGDPVYMSYCLAEIAKALESVDQQVDAVKVYEQIDAALSAAGFQNFGFHGAVKGKVAALKAEGYDPNAKPGDEVGPAGNTATSWSDDPAGQAWSDPIPMRLIIDEDVLDVETPNPGNSRNTFRWQKWQLSGSAKTPFEDRFRPMGQSFSLRREGVKVFLDDGSGKEREIKVLSTPSIVEMKRTYKDWDGNESVQEYAWFAASGGEENIFGLEVNFTPQINQPLTIRYAAACYLRGKVLGEDLIIYDDNASGRFGDPQAVRDGLSTWQPEYTYNDAMKFGRQKVAGPYAEIIEVDGDFYRVKIDPDSYAVRTRKLSVDTGTVKLVYKGKVKPAVVVIEEIGEFKGIGFFTLDPKKPVTVPVGRYKLSYGLIRKGKGKNEDTCEIFPGDIGSFKVDKGEEAVLELGAPFKLDFKIERTGGGIKIVGKSMIVRGKSGEMYTRFYDDPPIPDKVTIKGAPGKHEFRKATFEDFRQDGAAVWFPLDLTAPVKSGQEVEVILELKKHDLLGSKIKSDPKKA